MVGFSNMAVAPDGTALNHTLTLLYRGYARYSYSITPRPSVITSISFFMQDYAAIAVPYSCLYQLYAAEVGTLI